MSKFDYTSSRDTASQLISDFGQAGQFIKSGDTGGYDEYGNVIAASPDVIIDGTVTPLLPITKDELERGGASIIDGDKACFFHSDTAPEIGYEHTQNGVKWRVVAVLKEITSVDGVNVFRKFQMRR